MGMMGMNGGMGMNGNMGMGMNGMGGMNGGMNGGANAPFNAMQQPHNNNNPMQQLNSNDAYDRQPVNPNRQRGRKPRAPMLPIRGPRRGAR